MIIIIICVDLRAAARGRGGLGGKDLRWTFGTTCGGARGRIILPT